MKKIIKPTVKILLLSLVIFAGYYGYVLKFSGTSKIRYIEPQKELTSFKELLQKPELKGKILYVDVWRTTCHPCLEDFKAAPELKQYFNKYGQKVAFLYLGADISVPGEEFRWKRMIKNKNLAGYHYFMSKEYFLRMWYEVVKDTTIPPSFPHYFIVNPQGEVIDDNAPRPTNKRLYVILEDAIANNFKLTANNNYENR